MSSAETATSVTNVAAGSSKPYFCYQCHRTITVTVSASADPFCPLCSGGFIEEYENPNPNPEHTYQNAQLQPFSDSFFPSPEQFSSLLPLLLPSAFPVSSSSATNTGEMEMAALDDSQFQNHLVNLRNSRARIQFVIENHPSEPGFRSVNFGDYFIGPSLHGLEQLIQQLSENDPNRHGPPPASESAINSLPTVKITDQLQNSEMNQCAVCKDDFEEGAYLKQMPCKHLYHEECLFPWLKSHNSCPVCRYELPTDNEYNQRMHGALGSGGSNSSGGRGSGGQNQTVGRRIRIQLPSWPFGRGSGSGTGGSTDNRHDYGGLD